MTRLFDSSLRNFGRQAVRMLYPMWALLGVGFSHAEAESLPRTPGLVASPVLLTGLSTPGGGATGRNALTAAARSALTIPLNLQFGEQSGVSFLYSHPAALTAGGAPTGGKAPDTTTYGFSNTLALGGSGVRMTGLMYFSGDKGGKGQAVSQALSFQRAGWQIDAHYQSVGKGFRGVEALRGAAPALGMQSAATAASAGQLESSRGRTDLGFRTHFDGQGRKFGFSYQQSGDDLKKTRTLQQSLSYGRSFAGGVQLEGGRDSLTTDPFGSGAGRTLTTTTNHLRLGWQNRQGLTFDSRWTQENRTNWKRAGEGTQFALTGPLTRTLSVDAHQASHTDGASGRRDLRRDLTATLNTPHFARLRGSRWVFNLAQAVQQGGARTDLRSLHFDADTSLAHLRLEYAGGHNGVNSGSSALAARGIRVTSLPARGRLQIDANYLQRRQSLGPCLPDVRDYSVRLQFPRLALACHTLDQRENPDGSVCDVVETNVQANGALSQKLAWNVQYDDTASRANPIGTESFLVGLQGTITAPDSMQLALGLAEKRVGAATLRGETVKMVYNCRVDDTDSVAVTSDMAFWSRKTVQTPNPIDANVRVDVAKLF